MNRGRQDQFVAHGDTKLGAGRDAQQRPRRGRGVAVGRERLDIESGSLLALGIPDGPACHERDRQDAA